MTTWIVFSRDRPAQLDLLLRSMEARAPIGAGDQVWVLYRATTDDFYAGYLRVRDAHPRVRLIAERTFAVDDLPLMIALAGDQVVFHCDDDVWLRTPERHSLWAHALDDRRLFAISYRLGRNTIECHPRGSIPQSVPWENPWRWAAEPFESDFGYPFSLDGCAYRRSDLLHILSAIDRPDGPNDFEHRACTYVAAHPELFGGWMLRPAASAVVSSPLNRVNDGYPNPCSDNPDWTPEALNERFLAGDRIALPPHGFVPRAAHEVLPPRWVASSAATGEGSQPTTAAAGREAIEHPKP